jgi:Zn-dependent protease
MRSSMTFGYAAGIPLKIHLNWFITAILISWSLSAGYFPYYYPGWGQWTYWLLGISTAMLFFGSVLLHELGHSLIALKERVKVNNITLFIFGGVAHIENEPETAGSEFRIVAAGPITSLTLAGIFFFTGSSGILGPHLSSAALYLGQMNVVLALFNLLPGFPLDGGRILRSALWKWTDDFSRSTRWATNAGVGVSAVFVLSGIALMAWGDLFSGGWIAFIGIYLGMAAKEGYRQVEISEEEYHPEDINLNPEYSIAANFTADRMMNPEVGRRFTFDKAYSSVFIMARVAPPEKKTYLESRRVDYCAQGITPDCMERLRVKDES